MPQSLNRQRLVVATALLGLVTAALVHASAARSEPFRGPYAGVEMGLDASNGPDGFTYGGFAGWNFRVGRNVVLGPEIRISDSTADLALGFPGLPGAVVTAESGRQIGASLRAGWLIRPDLLAFGRVGWENLKVRASFMGDSLAETDDSVTLGAGIEYAIGTRWSIRGTYDWVEGSDRHLVKAGVAFHF